MTGCATSERRLPAARRSSAVAATLLLASIAAGEPAPPAELSLEVRAKISEAQRKVAGHEYQDAVKLLKAADKLADGKCAACQLSLARVFNNLGEYKDVAKSVEALEHATTDPRTLALGYNELAGPFCRVEVEGTGTLPYGEGRGVDCTAEPVPSRGRCRGSNSKLCRVTRKSRTTLLTSST
ncbi:MAG: hypothetical protein ABI609_06930 [Acidobacteriota bacterium]